ncbi:MAG TPA: TldD/PmbA family protein [Candidatus Dormibacteraeota bacterium]|nr:TldD/PmbA family protein [Candidatus Dormibacteraeota bacterium]
MSARARDELLETAAETLRLVSRGEAEVTAVEHDLQLTRFANNVIHQNVAEHSLQLRVRVIDGGKVGVAQVRGSGDDLRARVVHAAEEARVLAGESHPAPLPAPAVDGEGPVAFSAATRDSQPEQRADLARTVIDAAAAKQVLAYGAVSTSSMRTAIINSSGLERFAESTQASLTTVVRGDDGAGYSARHAVSVEDLAPAEVADEAVDTCLRNQAAVALEPGVYEVVLSPFAVTDLLEHLSWVGFSALAKQEQRSFMRPGEQLMGASITIADDPHDEQVFPYPFDHEGVASRRVTLIDRGTCSDFVYDTPTALRDGVESTGHSLPQPNTFGPLAMHLVMAPGDGDVAQMIGSVQRGLYINRFWYVRDVHPLRTIITGMTREGTFLIEQGRLSRPVRDLRFTQSIVDALADVRGVSSERRLELSEDARAVLSPWLHLGHFAFTS